jgi:hypothetical protein
MTMIGTSTNLLVDGVARNSGMAPFSIFEIAPVGLPMAVVGITYLLIFAPRLLRAKSRPAEDLISAARGWAWSLAAVPAALTLAALFSDGPQAWLTATLVIGLLAFGAVFAVNSSLHSYLILSFTKAERVTMDVGFYYMANAAGRLLGTLMSGLSYQIGGLPLMLGAAAIMVALSALLVGFLKPDQG